MNTESRSLLSDFFECYVETRWKGFSSRILGTCPWCLESVVFKWAVRGNQNLLRKIVCKNCQKKSVLSGKVTILEGVPKRKVSKLIE